MLNIIHLVTTAFSMTTPSFWFELILVYFVIIATTFAYVEHQNQKNFERK